MPSADLETAHSREQLVEAADRESGRKIKVEREREREEREIQREGMLFRCVFAILLPT